MGAHFHATHLLMNGEILFNDSIYFLILYQIFLRFLQHKTPYFDLQNRKAHIKHELFL